MADPFGNVRFKVSAERMGAEHGQDRTAVVGVEPRADARVGLPLHLESGRDLYRMPKRGLA
ncbi:hypothetical protein LCM4579_02585 [Ensifer sp. LCM 4579]|nr:hypothetical protein LCM4579_02585 [Ensifer sp. LCM 4579]